MHKANESFNVLSFWKLFVVVKCYLSHYLVFLDDRKRCSNFNSASV